MLSSLHTCIDYVEVVMGLIDGTQGWGGEPRERVFVFLLRDVVLSHS